MARGGPGRAAAWARRHARRARSWLVLAAILLVGVPALLWLTAPDGSEYAGAWPERTAFMELRLRQAADEGRELAIRYRPVPLSRVPESLRRAVRVSEDAAFYQHAGVDWHEVRAAVREAWREEEAPRGASTLTMQLARNLYLSPERSLWRKLREVIIAVKMEGALEKRRIFELYLSVIELGRGVFGVEAASRHYWGVGVAGLGPGRAAELAATIPAPLSDNPSTRTRRFAWRTSLIARRAFADTAAADTAGGGLGSGRFPREEDFPGDSPAAGAAAGDTAGAGGLPHADTVGPPEGADTAAATGTGGASDSGAASDTSSAPRDSAAVPDSVAGPGRLSPLRSRRPSGRRAPTSRAETARSSG